MKTVRYAIALGVLCLALPALAAEQKAPAADAARAAGPAVVNINSASAAQLAYLPRVGMKAAERIVEYRKAHGPFHRIEDVMQVKGVGEKMFTFLKPHLSVSGPTTLSTKVKSTGWRGGSRKAAHRKAA